MRIFAALFASIILASITSHASAQTCVDSVQGTIAWDGGSDTSWAPANVNRLCAGAPDSLEPGRCFERIMSGIVNWGGSTSWNPVNAVNLCQGSVNANATITCFQSNIASGVTWQNAIPDCQPDRLSPSASAGSGTAATSPGLPAGSTFGTRTSVTTLGGETVYRISCRNCASLYCQPGDEIISNGGSCALGVLSRLTVGQTFEGPCSGAGCWLAMVGCKGTRFEPLDPVAAQANLQATCIDK